MTASDSSVLCNISGVKAPKTILKFKFAFLRLHFTITPIEAGFDFNVLLRSLLNLRYSNFIAGIILNSERNESCGESLVPNFLCYNAALCLTHMAAWFLNFFEHSRKRATQGWFPWAKVAKHTIVEDFSCSISNTMKRAPVLVLSKYEILFLFCWGPLDW